jgi:hypothetical protein
MNHLTLTKAIAVLALIFIAGGAAGAVLTLKNTRAREAQPASVEKACTRMQDKLISKLGLTEAQVKKLRPVFDQTAQQLRAIRGKAICESDAIIRRAHEQIAKELNPEQTLKLEECDQQRRDWVQRQINDVKDGTKGNQPAGPTHSE